MFTHLLTRAAPLLSSASRDALVEGVLGRTASGGGFVGRGPGVDLYYAPFGLAVLKVLAPRRIPAPVREYLAREQSGVAGLDWVHRCCLAQSWLLLDEPGTARRAAVRLQDGLGGRSVQDRFLAGLVLLGLGLAPPALPGPPVLRSVPEAAAWLVLEAWHGRPASPAAWRWLEGGMLADGGLLASPQAAEPDLLSLATGAIALLEHGRLRPDPEVRKHVLFIASCRRPGGCFAASPADPDPVGDVEYSFYALAALGALVSPAPPAAFRPKTDL